MAAHSTQQCLIMLCRPLLITITSDAKSWHTPHILLRTTSRRNSKARFVGKMAGKYDNATPRTMKGFKKILAVTIGTATDMHGQDPTIAAIKAVSNACEASSLPSILDIPGGIHDAKVKIKVAVPNPKGVDKGKVAKAFPYGKVEVKVVGGGLRWHSGIVVPKLGDPSPEEQIDAETSDDEDAEITSNDELMVAVAAVRVGY